MGVNVLSPDALALIKPGQKLDMPDLLKLLLKQGKKVNCYRSECYWQDIGRFDDYQQASADFTADPDRFIPRSR
jgi:NDP-sugar pyrophosphorylase family protein